MSTDSPATSAVFTAAPTTLLLDRGADVNTRATIDDAGVGGQTAIFHAATQFHDRGLPMVQLLLSAALQERIAIDQRQHDRVPARTRGDRVRPVKSLTPTLVFSFAGHTPELMW
jgi:ankyrin repeat protein